MTLIGVLWLWLSMVTPSPGWSTPILVTEENNSSRPVVLMHRDNLGRFHLVWAGYKDSPRIGYKMFDLNGTTIVPDTMISRNTHSVYLSTMVTGDSLYVFWREVNPVYYSVRSLTDGSEIVPATYLFTTSTLYPYIRASADSLGRLHVLYNKGSDVIYAVWNSAPGSGFTVEREWKIEGAEAGGVLLVDGNRVHIVVLDSVDHDFSYLQYDLDGNITVPLTDFTTESIDCSRFPELGLDSNGNLMVVEQIYDSCWSYVLWKIDCTSGFTMIDMKHIVDESPPEMYLLGDFMLRGIPGTDLFYLVWTDSQVKQILFLLMDSNGNAIVDWAVSYDYSDEDPEGLPFISGQTDSDGNLYIAYEQSEPEPIVGKYPTFGWFDYDYVSIEQQQTAAVPEDGFSFSSNPVTGSVTVYNSCASQTLRVYDISGREVSSIAVSDGVGIWYGIGFSGERLPTGIYNIIGDSTILQRITLLN
jgi:hypothetical protein